MLRIEHIRIPSPASTAGLRESDLLVSIDGNPLEDWLDFVFHGGGSSIQLAFRRGGIERKTTLRRSSGKDWGITFRGQEPRRCRKRCVFCFVDQMPKNVRPSLKVKDDDVRYSFTQGTYVTLDDGDVDFVVSRGLSPIHVSVHSTDPAVRGRLLGTDRDEPVMDRLNELSNAGVEIETQIVFVPGYNDLQDLERTLEDLHSIDKVRSVGIVPVGLTRFRQGLPPLRRPSRSEAARILETCSSWRIRSSEEGRGNWVFPSDELFIIAGVDIPDIDYYADCTLRENGIGMLAELQLLRGRRWNGDGLLLTGALAAPFIRDLLEGSGYTVVAVENRFLGTQVGVAGLMSGTDAVRTAAEHRCSYNRMVLPSVMFNHDMKTIDDLTPSEIGLRSGMDVVVLDRLEELE